MTPRHRRLCLIGVVVAGMALATGLALRAFNENLLYFYSPTQVHDGEAPPDRAYRVGGMVVDGTFSRVAGSLTASFELTDYKHNVTVSYTGILPDLFREGQGVVVRGRMDASGVFAAEEVLAKHDENYMPPEVEGVLYHGESSARKTSE